MDIGSTYGERIVFFRLLKGWNQKQLWEAAGFTQSHLSDMENNHAMPDAQELERLALFLEQPVAYLCVLHKVELPAELLARAQAISQALKAKGRKRR